MSKLTALDIVQDVMSDMGSDSVTTVSATTTSEKVLRILRSTYEKMMSERDWPHMSSFSSLTALGDVLHPSHMKIPETIKRVEWIRYNKKQLAASPDHFLPVEYKTPEEFLDILNSRDSTDTTNNTLVTDFEGIPLIIRNNHAPSYWTSFDDVHIVFDSFDSALEASLVSAKTQCKMYKNTVWGVQAIPYAASQAYSLNDVMQKLDTASGIVYYYKCTKEGTTDAVTPAYTTTTGALQADGTATFLTLGVSSLDAFIPDLPDHLFPLLLSETKSQCFNKIKQVVDSQEERDSQRQRTSAQIHTYRQDGEKLRPSYGRS